MPHYKVSTPDSAESIKHIIFSEEFNNKDVIVHDKITVKTQRTQIQRIFEKYTRC
jgi:hypothetical protein